MQVLAWTMAVGRQSPLTPTVLRSGIRNKNISDPKIIWVKKKKNNVGDAGLGMDNGGGPAVATTNGLENLTGQVPSYHPRILHKILSCNIY
jgi:hypothetical protein